MKFDLEHGRIVGEEDEKQKVLKNKLFQKLFGQFLLFKQLIDKAEKNKKREVIERFKTVFIGFDQIIKYVLKSSQLVPDTFLDQMWQDPQERHYFTLLLEDPERYRDGEAGILCFKLDNSHGENSKILIPDLPPYQGQDFKADFISSIRTLASVVKKDPSIQTIVIETWLFEKKWVGQLFSGGTEQKVPEPEGELGGSQRYALLFNSKALTEYLTTGKRPTIKKKIYTREEFIQQFSK